MGRFDGKAAFITGAARGQGRTHAVRLAREGANVMLFDLCADPGVGYPSTSEDDLAHTEKLCRDFGVEVVSTVGDIRHLDQLQAAVDTGFSRFGRLDLVCANVGICTFGLSYELTEEQWENMIDINLSGQWRTVRAALPKMIEAGNGGSIVITSSAASVGHPFLAHYSAAKEGLGGLCRSLAVEVGKFAIRVNTVHPVTVNSAMSTQDPTAAVIMESHPDLKEYFQRSALRVWMIEPDDVTDAVVWLLSDESKFVTGTSIHVDAGNIL